jgi:tRNA(Ile)-lysidine synthase
MVCEELRAAVLAGGMFALEQPVVALFSGGRDSTCLLDIALAVQGAERLSALHVNYGLRAESDDDERHCVELCERLEVELEVLHAGRAGAGGRGSGEAAAGEPGAQGSQQGAGNLQAWARDLRYAAAAASAERRGALIATGHTASDQVETILYRLAASPGRRALLGMVAAEGRLIRPLLGFTREQTAAYCRERRLPWREDASNADARFARTRVREGLLPALRAVHPAAEANVLRTARLLREETELLEQLVSDELAGAQRIAASRLGELPAALARLIVVRLAEQAAGTYVPQAGERVEEILALARRGGRAELHVGGLAGAVIEGGHVYMVRIAPRGAGVEQPPRRGEGAGQPPRED